MSAHRPRGGPSRHALSHVLARALVAVASGLLLAAPAGATSGLPPLATPSTQSPLPEALRSADNWQRWGSGEFTWFGLRLYRATLWVAGDDPAHAPHALYLVYSRDIPASRLVSTSLDEMRRLGAQLADLARWEATLQRIFPDVRRGETITGVHVPGRGARFYHQSRHLGDVDDPEFAARFFAIWLDPRSRDGELRTSLLRRPGGRDG